MESQLTIEIQKYLGLPPFMSTMKVVLDKDLKGGVIVTYKPTIRILATLDKERSEHVFKLIRDKIVLPNFITHLEIMFRAGELAIIKTTGYMTGID